MIFFLLFKIVSSQSDILTQAPVGCLKYSGTTCTELCILGVRDCSALVPQCEYGYFLFNNTCVQCPYQNVVDQLNLYCMDCVEAPYSWNQNRKCSYGYTVGNRNATYGAFIKNTYSYSELYFVGTSTTSYTWSGSITRDTNIRYQVYICSGCSSFCDPTDIGCNSFTNDYSTVDIDKKGIQCLDGFYFQNGLCLTCAVSNCLSCTSQACSDCATGYAYSTTSKSCISCPTSCISCSYVVTTLLCDECDTSDDDQVYVVSLSKQSCDSCGTQCIRCEYVTYNYALETTYPTRYGAVIETNLQSWYYKRCRQCISDGFTISYDGINCDPCTITYCSRCYYKSATVSTLDLDFQPWTSSPPPPLKCYYCESGYTLDENGLTCTTSTTTIQNCLYHYLDSTTLKCFQCQSGYVLYNNQCQNDCTVQITNCLYCFAYTSPDSSTIVVNGIPQTLPSQLLYQCIKCATGYYPDFFTGVCKACNSFCSTCWQYTLSYNFTDYLQTKTTLTDDVKSGYQSLNQEKPYCSSCRKGYTQYSNECQGCSQNCVTQSSSGTGLSQVESACKFLATNAFCGMCYNSYRDRSLEPDETECHECPTNCQACRVRTDAEKQLINPYFNPSNTKLLKYGYLCYKYQSNLANGGGQFTDYNSNLNMPITCSSIGTVGQTGYCSYSQTITVQLYCDDTEYANAYISSTGMQQKFMYKLSNFMSITTQKTAQILFSQSETFTEYNTMNQNSVQTLTFIVQLVKVPESGVRICKFQKSVDFVSNFQQNVFSLQNFIYILQGSQNSTLLQIQQQGIMQFPSISNVIMQGISLTYYSEGDDYQSYFGFSLAPSIVANLQLINFKAGRNYEKGWSTANFYINFTNCQSLQMNGVQLYNLTSELTDQINFLYSLSSITNQAYTIDGLTFKNCTFTSTVIFQFNQIKTSNTQFTTLSSGLIFDLCNFTDTFVFGQPISNQALTANMMLQNIQFKFCTLSNSSLVNLNSLLYLQINKFDVVRCSLTSSFLVKSNHFDISNAYFDNNYLYSGSQFFYSVLQVIQDDSVNPSINTTYKFANIHIQYTYCIQRNCIMELKTPNNNGGILANLSITNFVLLSTDATDLVTSAQSSEQLISLGTFEMADINNFISDNNKGIRIISMIQINYVLIKNGLYDQSDTDIFSNGTLMASNKRIPVSVDCAETRTNNKLYSDLFLYISEYIYGVVLDTITVRQQISIDTSFIVIVSWDILQQNTSDTNKYFPLTDSENIVLNNLYFITNSLTITSVFSQISSLYIESQQIQTITMSNCLFIGNHLHKLLDNSVRIYTTALYFSVPLADVTINNCQFTNNRATNSNYGIAIIVAENITVIGTQFQKTNQYDMDWYNRLETPSFIDNKTNITQAMISYFIISSVGGNLQLTGQNINITQCSFSDGYAKRGTGLYIIATEVSTINISLTTFSNQQTSLSQSSNGYGGCLFVDSSEAALSMTLDQVSMQNCIAYTSGCIYLSTSTTMRDIYIKNSIFDSCQALDNIFLGVSFSSSQITTPYIYISNSKFLNNQLRNYMMNLNVIDVLTLEAIFTSQLKYFYQANGKLSIKDSTFSFLQASTILKLSLIQGLSFDNVILSHNIIFLNPLVHLQLSSQTTILVLKDTKFINNYNQTIATSNEIDALSETDCNVYFTPTSYYLISEQNCNSMSLTQLYALQNHVTLYSSVVLYNEAYQTKYSTLTDLQKYGFPIVQYNNIINLPTFQTFTTIPTFSTFTQQNFTQLALFDKCLFSLLYYKLGIQSDTSLFIIKGFHTSNLLTVSSLILENNYCLLCTSGLFIISQIELASLTISFVDTTCQNNTIAYYGCILLASNSTLSNAVIQFPITDLPVFNQSAEVALNRSRRQLSTTESLILSSSTNTATFDTCKFVKNRAKVGGGLSVQGVNTAIINTQFQDNSASLMAGGLFFDSSLSIYQLQMYNVQFQGNVAQVGAGLFISSSTYPSFNDDSNILLINFQHNFASVSASNLEELPRRLTVQMKDRQTLPTIVYQNNTGYSNSYGLIDSSISPIIDILNLSSYSIQNYPTTTTYLILPSGQAINTYKYYYAYTNEQVSYDWQFRIINLDRFNQTMSNLDSTESCKVTGRVMDSDNYDDTKSFVSNFTDKTSYYFNTTIGAFDLDSMVLTFDPYLPDNLFLQLKFVCTSIKIPVFNSSPPYQKTTQTNSNYALYVNVRTFPCQLGEAYNLQKCTACSLAEQTYAMKVKQISCSSIDQTFMASVKPTAINLRAHYYRPYFDSSEIAYCLNLVANCNGGWDPGDPSCYTGHIGALCESCDIYGTRGGGAYSLSSSYQCGACSGTTEVNSLIIVGMSVFTLVSIILSVKGSFKMLEEFAHQQRLASIGVLISNESSKIQFFIYFFQLGNLSILIKLFTNYFQIISALTTFQLSFPSSLTSTIQVVGNPTKSMSYSLDCFLIDLSSIEILYFRMLWALLMPIIYLSVFFLGYFVGVLANFLPYKVGIIYTTFIYMFIYLQPTLVGGFMSLASTRDISGYSWVQADVAYRSDSDTHIIWLVSFVTPWLIAWAFLFPSIFFYFVRQIRNDLDNLQNRMKLGYFYNEYNQEGYLWEFVKIFSKELIIIALTFYEDAVVIKGLIVFLIIFFYGGFTIIFTPYSSKRLNFIDRLSTAICSGSICLGVLIYSSTQEGLDYLVYIMFIIIAILNIGFILLMIYYLFQGYLNQFQELLDKARDYIRIYHPQIAIKYPWSKKMLINQTKMKLRVRSLWAQLRQKVKQGIKRRRVDPSAPLFLNEIELIPQLKPFDCQENDALCIQNKIYQQQQQQVGVKRKRVPKYSHNPEIALLIYEKNLTKIIFKKKMKLIGETLYNQPQINRSLSQMILIINFFEISALILSLDDQYEYHKVDLIFEYFRNFTQVFLIAPILKDSFKLQQIIIVIISIFTVLPYFILIGIYISIRYQYKQGRAFKNLLIYINFYATILRAILYIPFSSILLDGCICHNKLFNCESPIQEISIIIFINISLQLYAQSYLIRLIQFKPCNLFQPMFNFSLIPKCLMFTAILLLSKYVIYDFFKYVEMILLNLIIIFNISESIINFINNFQINYHIFVLSMMNFSLLSINEVIILQQKQSIYTQNVFITIILIFTLICPLSKQVFKIAQYNINCQHTNNQNKIIYVSQIIQNFCNDLQNQVKDDKFFEMHKLSRHHMQICLQCQNIKLTSIKQVRVLIQCIIRQQNNRLQQGLKYEFELLQLIYIDYISEELKKPLLAFVELKNYENHKFNLQSQYFRLIQRKLNNNLIQSIEIYNSETRNQFQKNESSFDIKQLSTTFQNYDYLMPIIQRIIDQKMKYWQSQIRGFDSIYSQHKLGIQLMKLVQQVQVQFKNQQSSKTSNLIQMKLNAVYYGAIMNDYYNCAIQEALIVESLNYERTIQTENIYNLLLIDDRIALIQLSLLKHKGKIVNANKQNLALYFGFELKQFQNISLITQLMPQYVAEIHDFLLLSFLKKSQSKLFNQYASIFSIDSQNYLIHSQLKLEYNFLSSDDFVLIGCMVKHKVNQEFLLFDTEGKILGTSKSFFIDYIQSFDIKLDLNKFINQCYIFLLFPGILQTLQGYKAQLLTNDQYLLIEENTFMFCRPNLLELISNFNRYLNNNKTRALEYHKSQGISIQIDNSLSEFDAITYNGAEMTVLDSQYVELIAKYVKGLDENQSVKHLVKYQIRHRSIGYDKYKRQYFEFEIINIRRKAAGANQTIDSTNKNTFQDDRNYLTSQTYLVNSSEGVKTDAINSEKPYQEIVPNDKEVQSNLQEIIKRLQGSKRNTRDQDSIQLFQIDSGRESMSFRPISQRANFMSPRINEQVEEESNQIDIDFNELQLQLNSISKVQENPDYQDQFEQSSVSLQKQHNEPSSEKKVSDQILKVMRKNKHDKNADDIDKSKSSINSGTSGSSATQIILKFQSAKHYTQGLKMISFINILVFLAVICMIIAHIINIYNYNSQTKDTISYITGPFIYSRSYINALAFSWNLIFFSVGLIDGSPFFFNQVYGDFQLIKDNFFDELKANQDIFLEMEQTGLLNKQDYILDDETQENQISFTYFTELIQENLFAIYEILNNKELELSQRLSDDYFRQLIQLRYNLNNVHLMSYNLIESLNTIFINQNQGYVGYQRTQTIIEIVVLFCIIFIQLYYWLLIERQIQQIILLAGRLQESDALELIARSMYIKDILNVQNGTWKKQNYYQICFEQLKKQNVDKVQSIAQIEQKQQMNQQQNNNKRKLNISLNSRIYKTQIILIQPILFLILAFLVLMLYLLGGFLLYQQESTNLLPQQKLLTEYIKFTSLFDTLMAQGLVIKTQKIFLNRLAEINFFDYNEILTVESDTSIIQSFKEISDTYSNNISNIFQQIVKSSNMESSDKQILFNLYEKDYCLELVQDVPFCSFYSMGDQAWIDEYGQFYPKDNNLDFIAKGIVGVISQVDLLINQIFYNELESLSFEQNLTLVLEQISTKQFNNAVFFHFLDTNDATDLFQRIIFKSTLGILSQNLKQLLIYYLIAGIGCLSFFSLSFITWIRMTNMKLIRTRLLLICLPPHVLTDIHTLQILKQLK